MSDYSCTNPDCTVAVTRKCVLSHDPPDSCPHVSLADSLAVRDTEAPQTVPQSRVSVYNGNELGWQQAAAICGSRYGVLVGLLGETGAGKTCLLSSLYLLASCGELRPNLQFAGSQTLPGFENRLRLLRKWDSPGLPDQIVDHTILPNERQPGFMHLTLAEPNSPFVHDLLLTDLPGEWTTEAARRVDKNERLMFLRRADVIVIALSSVLLVADESRNSQIQFVRMLLQRLRDTVRVDVKLPLIFALTRCDKTGQQPPAEIYKLMEVAESFGFSEISFNLIASFSDRSDVPSGMGVAELTSTILRKSREFYISNTQAEAPSQRMFCRFIHEGGPT